MVWVVISTTRSKIPSTITRIKWYSLARWQDCERLNYLVKYIYHARKTSLHIHYWQDTRFCSIKISSCSSLAKYFLTAITSIQIGEKYYNFFDVKSVAKILLYQIELVCRCLQSTFIVKLLSIRSFQPWDVHLFITHPAEYMTLLILSARSFANSINIRPIRTISTFSMTCVIFPCEQSKQWSRRYRHAWHTVLVLLRCTHNSGLSLEYSSAVATVHCTVIVHYTLTVHYTDRHWSLTKHVL